MAEPSARRRRRPIYCTIVAANYLPRALLLRDSMRRAHGDVDFRILLVEHPAVVAHLRTRLPDQALIGPDEIGCPQWLHMAFYYDVMEYATALKPSLIRTLLREGDVVYIDPDIEVFSPLSGIEDAVAESDIVLTPHVTRPLPDDDRKPSMKIMLQVGQFNLGFIGVGRGEASDEMMAWWQGMLVEKAIADLKEGLFTDQFWAAAFASFAPRLRILRSAQYNMAYWNVFQRRLEWDGQGAPQTEDGPLVFFHYSGLDRRHLEAVSRHQDRVTAPPGSPLHRLLSAYLDRLDASPYAALAALPYSFGSYIDGQPVRPAHRRAFLGISAPNRRVIYNPFAERAYVEGLANKSVAIELPDLETALERARLAEERLNTLPYSLVGYTGNAIDLLMPGSRDRIFNTMRFIAYGTGRVQSQLLNHQYGQALHDLAHFSGRMLGRLAGRS